MKTRIAWLLLLMAAGLQAQVGASTVTSIGGYSGWTTFPSDAKFKVNIRENVSGLDFILKLRPVTYNLDMEKLAEDNEENGGPGENGNPGPKVISPEESRARSEKAAIVYSGFIAQEVESAARTAGYDFSGIDIPKNDKGHYGLRYAEFVMPLVKAV